MDTPLFLNVVAYVLLILVLQYIKFKFPDSTFIRFFQKYGWWLIGLCFVAILVILAGPQFQNPFNALDVLAIGVMLVFGYFFIKDKKSKHK
ncbi:hypothetical protein P4G59_07165 [Lactiplantibacillus plantarum]|uniref:hypothetical protein n=1 Tax=Lactiplantibacillus TaxID=2767842 RepID=UPI000B3CB02C|nr:MULTISPECIES: hypothetical protein [Lactiplantibacillus]AUH36051.1 hypothetical protein CXZ13_01480 [Lactiplantibacillus plantarum]MCH7258637.1 hypothetical protein [Lactiplantibacillus sp. ME-2]MCT3260202.1 hypothetical protein [Lactiplantibacillus plantarum]MCT4440370.1 hypothetical protein [Lactiplantibacillus plantarum]MDN6419199.1 hypothetical protein [Lactiplantibacillus plantarum]